MSFFQLAFWHATTHILSLPLTEYLVGGHTHMSILTLDLQGGHNFPTLLMRRLSLQGDKWHILTASEDKPQLVFFPLYHVFILHYFILSHPPTSDLPSIL